MEFYHLTQFVAVAEELHFRRAAVRLGMKQPPLSQSIRRLEVLLGITLFERSKRSVSLTSAGIVLLDEARRILKQVEQTKEKTKRAASSGEHRLRVGFTPISMFTALPRVVQQFRARWPHIEITLEERQTHPQIELMKEGKQDVGILYRHSNDSRGLASLLIERSPLVIALPAKHPLTSRKRLELSELSNEEFVSYDPTLNPDAHSMFSAACRHARFVPNVVQYANQTYTILSLVANDVGISLIGKNARSIGLRGVVFLPVTGIPDDLNPQTVLAWPTESNLPGLRPFIGLFEEVLQAEAKRSRPSRSVRN